MNIDCRKVWNQSKDKLPPHQMMITETLIKAARSYDICWICGDEEQLSSVIVENDNGEAIAGIICLDCFVIQKNKGTIFVENNPIDR